MSSTSPSPQSAPTAGAGDPSGGKTVRVEISPAELIDKITILEIKTARIEDAAKKANVARELVLLSAARDLQLPPSSELDRLSATLREANEALWSIEDEIRACEAQQRFDAHFVELARAVYRTNDLRSAVKRDINRLLGAGLIEEKQYTSY